MDPTTTSMAEGLTPVTPTYPLVIPAPLVPHIDWSSMAATALASGAVLVVEPEASGAVRVMIGWRP